MVPKLVLVLLYSLSVSQFFIEITADNNFDFDVLNQNLFESLKLHPKLNVPGNLNEQENFIEKYVDDYFELTAGSFDIKRNERIKRSLSIPDTHPKDDFGNFMFSGIKLMNNKPIYNATKYEYFHHFNEWFFVTIEESVIGNHKLGTNLLIYKIQNNTYSRMPDWKIYTVGEFWIYPTVNLTYIVAKASDQHYSGVYEFDGSELLPVQNIEMENVSDVSIWETETKMHMAISGIGIRNQTLNFNETKNYRTTFVYKWDKYYFNLKQVIDKLADRLLAFTVEGHTFLLLNLNKTSRDFSGEYSEIYRLNLENGLYEIYQRIPTYNCTDVKFFSIQTFDGYDNYLIMGNHVNGENVDEIPPIIYKYVNGYFLPFQNLHIENIMEIQIFQHQKISAFLLLARTEYQGLKTYQYDGWVFQETSYDINSDLGEEKISNAKFDVIENGTNVLVLGFNRRKALEFYMLDFVYENEIFNFLYETLQWCKTSVSKLSQIPRQKREAEPVGKEQEQNISKTNDELVGKIQRATFILEQIEQQTANSLQYEGPHIIQDLSAQRIIMLDPYIRSLSTDSLNDVKIDEFLGNVIDINEDGEWPNNIVLERAQLDSQIHPDTINGKNIENVISTSDNLSLENLTVLGETKFLEPVITETLNYIPFDEEHILMKETDQSSRHLVDRKLISKISTLKASRVEIGGLMNEVSMRTLDKYALRKSGDQVLTEKYHFGELHVGNIQGSEISDERLEDLVRIDHGSYKLDAEVKFTNPLSINNLSVTSSLDKIPVTKGKLEVLLKDSTDIQNVKAEKLMNDVEILSPIELKGNIDGFEGKKLNTLVNIDGPFVYEGDFAIQGNTTIEKLLLVGDIRSADGNFSVKRVLSHGISLREKVIDMHLDFNQQLNVDEIFVDNINGLEPENFVVTGSEKTQNIRGAKIFLNDVNITGSTNFFKINDILVSDFDKRLLSKSGDQVIIGKHTFMDVVASTVTGNMTLIGNTSWDNILTPNTEQVIMGTTVINNDVEANLLMSESANVNGTTNGYNFTDLAQDTVTSDSSLLVTGHKTFKNLKATDLSVANMELTQKLKFTIDNDVRMENVSVENLHFLKTCNDIEASKFGTQFQEDAQEIVSDKSSFDDLVVLGNVFIESGYLGDMDLEGFERDTVKLDEEHTFGKVVFKNHLVSENNIELLGEIEKVDLENVVLSNSRDFLSFLDRKTFLNNLTVTGTVFLEESVNDYDMTGMCKFSDLSEDKKEMEIYGTAVFVKGPQIRKILNETFESIYENVWFKNREVSIVQDVSFKKITYRSNVTVKGTVDGVNLDILEKEYFSKTKDQAITGGLYFADNVLFSNNLICPEVAMNGAVNGLKIKELPRTVLLQDMDQLFEEIAYFENIVVDDLQGEFSVNNYSLEMDLMRYDGENVVTGTKSLNTLIAKNIELKQNTTIQDVDVLRWMQNAVLKKGTFVVEKRKILQDNVHFDKALGLLGSLNGEMFTNETIMLKSVPQRVTGVKTFELRPMELMKFRNVKLKGFLNDMQMSDLLEDQSGSGDIILKSPMHFNNDIHTQNINLRKPFRHLDMEAFLSNLKDLEKTNLMEKYAKLLNTTVRINRNLEVQAFYLQSYKELQKIENPQFVINSCCDNPTLIFFDYINDSYYLYYYYWDQDLNKFQKSVNLDVKIKHPLMKILAFSLDRQQFLYFEYPTEEQSSQGLFKGQFMRVENLNNLIEYGSIISNGIRQITPVQIEGAYCILVIYESHKSPHIFCEFNLGHMKLLQPLPSGQYIQSEVLNIDGITFLILLNINEENVRTSQAGVEIWCLHESQFGIRQVLYFSDPPPKSISAITYRGYHYLSIVYRGGIQQGHIDILRYSKSTGNFEQWQKITSNNQVKAEFSILPSGELFFFVLGPSNETLTIYKYVGVSGFREEITIPSSNDIQNFKQFTLGKKHFVMINTQDELKILQAQFKGSIVERL
ncbi:uncharacterized protein LOC123684687 [Harmonia axyridis]|uniref:uncharacterized protein LOC123684687 n=1 Tax=Harmonia axyridis TaxID=115357 RepID=UPI001E27648F|nr:uncharacterized protein LOC123684687 [Harmonia axyridis]